MCKTALIIKHINKSKFVRSIFLRMMATFVIACIIIASVILYLFNSEMNKKMISEKQEQLAIIESTISERMDEVSSIAYSIGKDKSFYLEPVDVARYTGIEMADTLERYLAGNAFIEYLAYYRLSEADKLYTSKGEISFSSFWSTYLGVDKNIADEYTKHIRETKTATVKAISYGKENKTFFSYIFPLPELSANPQAFVLIMIPLDEVEPLLCTQFINTSGIIAVFDNNGNELHRTGTLDKSIKIDINSNNKYITYNGGKYAVQKHISPSNGWTYISVIQTSGIISGLTGDQLTVIIIILLLMLAVAAVMLVNIIIQYKPISSLAADVGSPEKGLVDEGVVLSDKLAALKDTKEQKQKYEAAYHEAEAANKAKSAFLSSMSHDIRTPMNAIIGMTAIASKHIEDPEYVKDCLSKVEVASRYLLDIINNVLDMSRIESGRFTLSQEVVELPKLINELKVILNQSVEAKHQQLTVEIGSMKNERVIGDSVRLMQVFMNIVSNAVKFTPDGGKIALSISQLNQAKDCCGDYAFTCTDTGIGMSADFVKKVFDTFSRENETNTSKVEGTGLGMAIAKNLAELMGGEIHCESELGKGTKFTVTLHLKLADESSRASGDEYASAHISGNVDLEGCRVLVVEDNDLNREIARRIIAETKALVVEAANGEEAVEAFTSHPSGYFNVILMDLQMPVMNGYEATAEIRASNHPDAKKIKIFAITANTFDEDVRQVKEAGMNGHIGKPYTPDELYKVLIQAMKS